MATRLLDRASGAIIAALALGLIAVLAGVIDAGPLDPPGSPSPTNSVKLPGTPISSVPFTINASGHYYVTGNLSYTGSANAIEIAGFVKYVTLDLGGFTLSGLDAGTGIKALGPSPPAQFPLQITNGYVRDFAVGIDMELAAHSRMDGVHVYSTTDDGIRMGNHDALSNCTVALSGAHGVRISSLSKLSDCYIVDNALSGILVNSTRNVIEGSHIIRNNTSGSGPNANGNIRFNGSSAYRNIIRENDLASAGAVSLLNTGGGGNVFLANTICVFDMQNFEILIDNINAC